MFEVQDGNLIIFIPRCGYCKKTLSKQVARGIGGADAKTQEAILSTVTMSPSVTWTQFVFRCKKHYDVYMTLSNEDIIELNKYPQDRVEFRGQ